MFIQVSGFRDDAADKTWVNTDHLGTVSWIAGSGEYSLATTTQGGLVVSEEQGIRNIKDFLRGIPQSR